MLYTKSILKEPEQSDGIRISVMSRHTLNDGITPDPRITENSYHKWIPSLGPPPKLIGAYYKRGLTWDLFEKQYLAYLHQPNVSGKVQDLASRCMDEDITLLCVEETPEHCHRRLLAEECLKYEPLLKIDHR